MALLTLRNVGNEDTSALLAWSPHVLFALAAQDLQQTRRSHPAGMHKTIQMESLYTLNSSDEIYEQGLP